jgi:hypothetical protein
MPNCFIVRDANGQAPSYINYESEPGRRSAAKLLSQDEARQFYINYSLNGEHYIMGPYHTRRFAMSHIDDVRRQPGVNRNWSSKVRGAGAR